MNTSLAIHADQSSEREHLTGNVHPAFRVVTGNDAHNDDTPEVGAVVVEKNASPEAQPLASPSSNYAKPHATPVSDVERLAGELDLEKVLFVPVGVTISGDIDTNGLASLVISGTVKGSVRAGAGAVIVRQSGVVLGSIHSDESVVIAGHVTNPDGLAIVTSGLWILAETAQVRGDVAYARQRAYEGSVFSGRAIPFSEYKA